MRWRVVVVWGSEVEGSGGGGGEVEGSGGGG